MSVKEKLELYLSSQVQATKNLPQHKHTFESHGFGAVEMAMMLDPENEQTYEKKWYDFKKTLDNLYEMWYNKDVERS